MKNVRSLRQANKGQMGPVGEDFIYYVMSAFAILAIITISIQLFLDYNIRYAKIDLYRTALVAADKLAFEYAWDNNGDPETKRLRVLDLTKVETGIGGEGRDNGPCKNNLKGVCIKDLQTDEYWACGKSMCLQPEVSEGSMTATAKLPVSLKIDYKSYHSGYIEVSTGN